MKANTRRIFKYIISFALVLVITAGFMLLPQIWNTLIRPQKSGEIKDIKLIKTVESLSKKEKATFFYDTRNAALFTEIYGDRTIKEYTAESADILDDVFGKSSELSKIMHSEYQDNLKNNNFGVRAFKYTAFYGGNVISLNLVLAQYGNLVIWYEEESKLALSVYLISDNDGNDTEYSDSFDTEDNLKPIGDYYTSLGLNKDQLYYYPTGMGHFITYMTAGIFAFAETQNIEIEAMKPVSPNNK